jgi:uncharacterized protein (TIGR02466 family)|tara:strand:+ start:1694 stop:2311 length:618 start_codon:yes stop_codon:yes gene_type:complete
MNDAKIHGLFPTPIYMSNINRKFTHNELIFIHEQKKHCKKNAGNINTEDNYILKRSELNDIKTFLQKSCNEYLKKVICPKNDIELYITQSWLNYTEKGQFHHSHTHPNSYVSGVLYINCDSKYDKILFLNSKEYKQIRPEVKKYNIWNSPTWWFSVGSGDLVMFPSSTTHQVETKQGDNLRISLAFNTFVKGKIGLPNALTELIL